MERRNPQLGINEALSAFEKEFTCLVNTTLSICNQEDNISINQYQKALELNLNAILLFKSFPYLLEEEDVRQELTAMWIEFLGQFYQNNPRCSLKQYLIRRSLWGIRDWVAKGIRYTTDSGEYEPVTYQQDTVQTELEFLIMSGDSEIFGMLTPHERSLLWSIYVGQLSVSEVSTKITRDPATVRKQVGQIIEQLEAFLLHQA